jgi:hypothetical protein
MKLKQGLKTCTSDFWYDLTKGGRLNPDKMCSNKEDAKKVEAAIDIVLEFEHSCIDQIPYFLK